MAEPRVSLARCYQGWDGYQHHLVAAVAPLSPEQLALRPAPRLRSVGEPVAHAVAARARWLSLDLRAGGPELVDLMGCDGWTEHGRVEVPVRGAAELCTGLTATRGVLQEALQRWTVADPDDVLPPAFPGEESSTRQFALRHLVKHDVHHGGEVSFALSMYGLPGIDL